MSESALPGGSNNHVVRVGPTVLRSASPRTAAVGDLLRLFETSGWSGAPHYRGIDAQGREVLTYLEGHTAWEREQPPAVYADESLVRVARLVRAFHDVTAGTELAGSHEVVCHNDLSPKNTVYRLVRGALRPVSFVDGDLAAPGARIHDVAHVCGQFLGLGPGEADMSETTRRLRRIADSYGLVERTDLVSVILWWQDRCWRGIEAGAEAGTPAMIRLREAGTVTEAREAYQRDSESPGRMGARLPLTAVVTPHEQAGACGTESRTPGSSPQPKETRAAAHDGVQRGRAGVNGEDAREPTSGNASPQRPLHPYAPTIITTKTRRVTSAIDGEPPAATRATNTRGERDIRHRTQAR
ncbi:hypothetical protein ABTY53_37075 [Streptomyces noursei]|uniref:hypothetical protein n=1 Tax=Streptomyces noursei TaxID=1971 RepID=UPI0033278B90